jgi:hypothetical protein
MNNNQFLELQNNIDTLSQLTSIQGDVHALKLISSIQLQLEKQNPDVESDDSTLKLDRSGLVLAISRRALIEIGAPAATVIQNNFTDFILSEKKTRFLSFFKNCQVSDTISLPLIFNN